MGRMAASEWHKLPLSLTELCINTTLRCGQSFRWKRSSNDEWSCVLHGRIVTLRQDPTHLHYKATFPKRAGALLTPPPSSASSVASNDTDLKPLDDTEALIKHYFNLSPNLTALYAQWSQADPNFRKKAPKFAGVRILRQDAWEALVGFICSSNNNIARISQMVNNLCKHYGTLVGYVDAEPYYAFPPAEALTDPKIEQELRQLGFGYRARYIYQTAVAVAEEKEKGWLEALSNPENPQFGMEVGRAGEMEEGGREGYRIAHEELLTLTGVGPKVADCVCLMGLGWGEAVPVDTHVWQIAVRDYKFGKGKHSSLTKATYDAIGNRFRSLWGKEAGWAHSVLFTADLRAFSERLVETVEKVETEEKTVIKKEEDGSPAKVITTKSTEILLGRGIKRESNAGATIEGAGSPANRTKRRRT